MPKLAQVCLNEQSTPALCAIGDLELEINDFCVIKNLDGLQETGYVCGFPHFCERQCADRQLPVVERRASSSDVRAWHLLKRRENEALVACKEMALHHKLDMKISLVRFDDRLHKVSFHFTAEKRVDFRELVKELAARFRARIELWQVGVRDEAKKLGGLGGCGRQMCCSSWMREFIPVSIRYAKAQDIQFSPSKLSGVCGRLRCCLAYEQDQYVEMAKGVPPVGATVLFGELGEGRVLDRNLLSAQLSLVFGEGRALIVPIKDLEISQRRNPEAEKSGKKQTVWVLERIAAPEPEPERRAPSPFERQTEPESRATRKEEINEKREERKSSSRAKQRANRNGGPRPENLQEENAEADVEQTTSNVDPSTQKEKPSAGRTRRRARGRATGGANRDENGASTQNAGPKKIRSAQRPKDKRNPEEDAQAKKKGQKRRPNQKASRSPRRARPDQDPS